MQSATLQRALVEAIGAQQWPRMRTRVLSVEAIERKMAVLVAMAAMAAVVASVSEKGWPERIWD